MAGSVSGLLWPRNLGPTFLFVDPCKGRRQRPLCVAADKTHFLEGPRRKLRPAAADPTLVSLPRFRFGFLCVTSRSDCGIEDQIGAIQAEDSHLLRHAAPLINKEWQNQGCLGPFLHCCPTGFCSCMSINQLHDKQKIAELDLFCLVHQPPKFQRTSRAKSPTKSAMHKKFAASEELVRPPARTTAVHSMGK